MANSRSSNNLVQLVAFLLGASAATLLLFFVMSAASGGSSSEESAWMNSTGLEDHHLQETAMEKNATVETKPPATNNNNGSAALDGAVDGELRDLLRLAADDDRRIIMTVVNKAWAAPNSLLDLFLESFRSGDGISHFLDHLIIVAVDSAAFARCRTLHPYCYLLHNDTALAGEQNYLSKDYLDLVWSKMRLQEAILELGYSFLFTDVDVVWFRNPLEKMSVAADVSTSCDFYHGDPWSPVNSPNTGFIYVKSNPRNVRLLKRWRAARADSPGGHEQHAFGRLKFELVLRREVRIQFLDPANFGGFCNSTHDFGTIYTMHANCCVGLGAKLHDLRMVLDDWKQYRGRPAGAGGPATWRLPGICMH